MHPESSHVLTSSPSLSITSHLGERAPPSQPVMAHPYHYSSYPYPSYYDYGPSAEDYPSASASASTSASASAPRSGRCEHSGKYGHASEKCWSLQQDAHQKPAHWPLSEDMDTTSGYASTSRRPPPRPSNLPDSMTGLRDRVYGGATSSSSTHPTCSPQDRRSPPPPPRVPYASASSSSARLERGPNGIAVDSGWGRRASTLNQGARSPRQAEVLDPRRRGASVRRPAEEGEITSEVSSLKSEAPSRDRPPHSGENRTRRDPRLEERQRRRGSDESAGKHQAHTGSSADLQKHLQDQFEVVERRNEHLSTIVNRPWPQQPYSRTQLASTLFSAIARLVPLTEELARKQAELDDAVQWVELNKDEAGAQETISQFEKETRVELQKAVEEARSAMEPVQREFTQALMQLVDYKWMIEAAQQCSAKNILHICQEMQDEYRTAFQKLDLDRKASIERASREASDQPRRISPRPTAAEDAPPAGAEASTSATATAPATTTTTTTTEGGGTAPSARTEDAVRALRNALKGMQRRLDRMEEETDATNEEAHAMQAEMVDNVAWEAREAVKVEMHAMRERKRRRVEVSEGTGEGTAATAATAAQKRARTASPAAPREDQDETMTQVGSTSAVPPPAEGTSSSSLTSAARASTSIDLEALSASLQPRFDSSIESIRTQILELAHQKAREDASAIEERVKSAFKAVEQEFTKVRAHTEERFDFLAAEMLRKDNEWKERFARYEAMQSETNEGLKRLAGGHASTRQLLMGACPCEGPKSLSRLLWRAESSLRSCARSHDPHDQPDCTAPANSIDWRHPERPTSSSAATAVSAAYANPSPGAGTSDVPRHDASR